MLSTQASVYQVAPPKSHISGANIAIVGPATTWVPVHNGKALISCYGASVSRIATGGGGLLAVHLVNDPVGSWCLLDFTLAGVVAPIHIPAEFDLIGDGTHGTTVTFDVTLTLWPGVYKDGSTP